MDKLLKEAIADAKTLRETAIANAKTALEEAFMPKIQSMLSTKISEETDDSLGEDEMDEAKKEGEEDTEMDEAKKEGEDEANDEMDEAKGDEDDIDLDEILAEIEAEDKAKTDEAKGDDCDDDSSEEVDEAKGDDEDKDEVDEAAKSDDDEEVDLDELLSSLGETKEEDEEGEKKEVAETQVAELKSELKEAKKTITTLRTTLNEVNLLNAKLLYVTRLIKENEMSKEQKVKILECFDKAKTVREVKLIHSTIAGSFNKKSNTGKTKLAEGKLNFASKSAGKSTKVIPEVDETVARFKKLANLK